VADVVQISTGVAVLADNFWSAKKGRDALEVTWSFAEAEQRGSSELLKKSIPEKYHTILFQAIGLFTLMLGFQMTLKSENPLIVVFSLIFGGLIGEFFSLEERIYIWGERLKTKIGSSNHHFTEGLVSAFLLFCVGSMTLVGTINEGLKHDPSLLLIKSVMDGFVSITLASTYGIGVLFSAIPLFLFQIGLTLTAHFSASLFSEGMIHEISAVGGMLIIGIGLDLLQIKKLKLINFLPALVVVVLLFWLVYQAHLFPVKTCL